MAICLLVLLLIENQWSYDNFNQNRDRVVRIISDQIRPGGTTALAAAPAYVGTALANDVPQVEQTVRVGQIRSDAEANEKAIAVTGLHVDPAFFDVLGFELIEGDMRTALVNPGQIVLTDVTAEKFFGTLDPMGQPFTLEEYGDYTVSGIVKTKGVQSHLRFDVLASFSTLVQRDPEVVAEEDNFWNFSVYALLKPGTNPSVLDPHLARYSERYRQPEYRMKVQPLTEIMMGPILSNEIAAYNLPGFVVWALLGLGLLVVVAATFNYVGLAIAQSIQRGREIGIRKTLGAELGEIRIQFLMESILTSIAALFVAMILLVILIPSANNLSFLSSFGIHFEVARAFSPRLLSVFALFAASIGILAGLFPAFRLARFDPSVVLRGGVSAKGGTAPRLRRGLAFIQLTLSFIFVVTALLLYRQFSHMLEMNYGFQVANTVTVPLQGNDATLLRTELLRYPEIREVGATSRLPAADGGTSTIMVFGDDTLRSDYFAATPGFLKGIDLSVVAGETLEVLDGTRPGVFVNETAVERMGLASPRAAVGEFIATGLSSDAVPILGVVRDFQVDAMAVAREPLFIVNRPANLRTLTIQYVPGQREPAIARAQTVLDEVDGLHTFEFADYTARVRDGAFMRVFNDQIKIIGLVSIIALLIVCLGLFSMIAFSAARRTKEIGIRRILGASVAAVTWNLTREFVVLTGVAAAVGLPLAYVANRAWLEIFYDRVSFGAGLLAVGSLIVIALVLLTVGSHAVRAARVNPVRSLRYE